MDKAKPTAVSNTLMASKSSATQPKTIPLKTSTPADTPKSKQLSGSTSTPKNVFGVTSTSSTHSPANNLTSPSSLSPASNANTSNPGTLTSSSSKKVIRAGGVHAFATLMNSKTSKILLPQSASAKKLLDKHPTAAPATLAPSASTSDLTASQAKKPLSWEKILRTEQKLEKLKVLELKTVKFIANGKYSSIYEVIDEKGLVEGKVGNHYALKEIPKALIKQHKLTLQIQNEIEIMYKQGYHANIIKLFTHLEDNFNIYLLTEYVNGWNLRQLQLIQPIAPKLKLSIISQLLKGVAYLHENNIIHRDLRPENILISSDNEVKISDFGWSNYFPAGNRKRMTRLEGGIIPGETFQPFTAPEIRAKLGHSEKVDIWCLAMIIYFILSDGEYPYGIPVSYSQIDEKTKEEIELRMRQNKFQLSASVLYQFPLCKPMLENMLNKDPSLRLDLKSILEMPFFQGQQEKIMEEQSQSQQQSPFIIIGSLQQYPQSDGASSSSSVTFRKDNGFDEVPSFATSQVTNETQNYFENVNQNENNASQLAQELEKQLEQPQQLSQNMVSSVELAVDTRKSLMRMSLGQLINAKDPNVNANAKRLTDAATDVRMTIKKETDACKAVEQINQFIQQKEQQKQSPIGDANSNNGFQTDNPNSQDQNQIQGNPIENSNALENQPKQSKLAQLTSKTTVPLFERVSYSQQKEYLENDFAKDFSKKMEEQLFMMQQQQEDQEQIAQEKLKEAQMHSALEELNKQITQIVKQEDQSTAEEQANHEKRITELEAEEEDANNTANNQGSQDDKTDNTNNKVDLDMLDSFKDDNANKPKQLPTIIEQLNENDSTRFSQSQVNQSNFNNPIVIQVHNDVEQSGIIEESQVIPFGGNYQEQDMDKSNQSAGGCFGGGMDCSEAVPMTGIESSTVVPFQFDGQKESIANKNSDQPNSNEDANPAQKQGITKVYSQLFGEDIMNLSNSLNSNLSAEFAARNTSLFQKIQASQTVNDPLQQNAQNLSKNIFSANKALLESLANSSSTEQKTLLESKLKKLKMEKEELLQEVEDSTRDLDKMKYFYLRNKDYRINDLDTPLSLSTSLTSYELEKCRNFEFVKYEHEEELALLNEHKEENMKQIELQQKQVDEITLKWNQIQGTRAQLNEKTEQLKKQDEGIEFINTFILNLNKTVLRYNNFQDLEKLKDSMLVSRESIHPAANVQLDQKEMQGLLKKISDLNKNQLFQSNNNNNSQQGSSLSAKERIRLLNDQEYQLKKEMISGVTKIDEEAKAEFEQRKQELQVKFQLRKQKQDDFFQAQIKQLEDNIAQMRLQDIPVQELEAQRAVKKHLDQEIQALETWLEKNSKNKNW